MTEDAKLVTSRLPSQEKIPHFHVQVHPPRGVRRRAAVEIGR